MKKSILILLFFNAYVFAHTNLLLFFITITNQEDQTESMQSFWWTDFGISNNVKLLFQRVRPSYLASKRVQTIY